MVKGSIETEERQRQILERARDVGSVRMAESAQEFGVHEMTIRRDFDALEFRGLGRRVRGAFVPTRRTDFQSRLGANNRAKRTIARKLVEFVPEQGMVSLDASTTVHEFAKILTVSTQLSVLTNSTATFDELQGRPRLTALLSGGQAEPENFALSGEVARRTLSSYRVHAAFMSSSALTPRGETGESTAPEAELKFTALAHADMKILAVDASKFAADAPFPGPRLADFDVLVTELDPANPRLDSFRPHIDLR